MMDLNQINMMNLNQMNMMMGNMNQQEKGKEIYVEIISRDSGIINVRCFEKEKASVLWEKLNLNNNINEKKILTLDYQMIYQDLTIEENKIYNGSKIYISSNVINIIFVTHFGSFCFPLDENCPIGIAMILFIAKKIGKLKWILDLINYRKLMFIYNANKLNISDNTPIKHIFNVNKINPNVKVIETQF